MGKDYAHLQTQLEANKPQARDFRQLFSFCSPSSIIRPYHLGPVRIKQIHQEYMKHAQNSERCKCCALGRTYLTFILYS